MVKEIPLQNGMVALVDDEDYERCMEYFWTVTAGKKSALYVMSSTLGETLQTFILRKKDGENLITFADEDRLNFRKSNLILVDKSFVINKRKGFRNSSSKYKGVYWNKRRRRWISSIRVDGKLKYLGGFTSEDEAAKVYNKAALVVFGEHAYQNIIGVDNSTQNVEVEFSEQKRSNPTSGYKGVCAVSDKWQSYIWMDGKNIYLGRYDTPEQAAKAYDKKAIELHGVKAILNFPNE